MFQVAVTSNYLPLYLVVALLLLVAMTMVNLKLQWLSLSQETFHSQSRETDFAMPSLSFLNRYGHMGMYLKLEIMSILRNPAIRKKYVYSVVITIVFSLVCAFTDIYNGSTWENFWCLYCFAISGITLISIGMQPEGNYIDLLMTATKSAQPAARQIYTQFSSIVDSSGDLIHTCRDRKVAAVDGIGIHAVYGWMPIFSVVSACSLQQAHDLTYKKLYQS